MSVIRPFAVTTAALSVVAALLPSSAYAAPQSLPTHVNHCWSTDKGRPVVDSLDLSPSVVDSDSGPTTIHITVQTHDTGGPGPATGVSRVVVTLNPTAPPTGTLMGPSPAVDLTRGPAGSWRGTVVVPTHTNATYDAYVWAEDKADVGTLSGRNDATRAFPADLHVTGTPASDTTPPQLIDLSVSATRIDTTKRAKTLTVLTTATDVGSGVAGVRMVLWVTGVRHVRPRVPDATNIPGTDRWRTRITVPRWFGTVDERLSVIVWDNADNSRHVRNWTLGKRGLPSSVHVVSGPQDVAGPHIVRVLHAPGSVDIRRHGQWYPIRLLVADRQGVANVAARFRSLEGSNTHLHRVSGTTRRGVWAGRIRIPRCSIAPVTTYLGISTVDALRVHGGRRIGTVRVRSTDHLPPTARGIWRTSPHVFTFSEPVHGISSSNVQVYDDNTSTGPNPLSGTWTCRDGQGHTVSCLKGRVLKATFHPDDPNGPDPGVVDWEPGHHLDVLDRHGNPFNRPSLSPDIVD